MSSDAMHLPQPDSSNAGNPEAPNSGVYSRLLGALEHADGLDRYVDAAAPAAQRIIVRERARRLFHGDTSGIPLHIIVKDLPFGAWFMAQFLDLFPDPGSRQAATRLVALGLASSGAAGITGWAEWAMADRPTRRVGIVHAAANGMAVLVFFGSWYARIRGRHGIGVGLGRVGGALLVIGGFLGGHMGRGRAARP
ncbi:DUF2231 domain-containing protein [Arthrobacter zhaoguopingii]|uniref:DUF2231 domain-containing protein n=1 Tax=Arthrobacter zhaoguopingii TaxID=2681491 RepID=UPI001FE4EDB6|nr:hypothetical protein [Arthrobacter zhaoguopingii]